MSDTSRMSSVSPSASASQCVVKDCVSPVPPVAPSFLRCDDVGRVLTRGEIQLIREYYAALSTYNVACQALGSVVGSSQSGYSSSVTSSSAVQSTCSTRSWRRRRRRRSAVSALVGPSLPQGGAVVEEALVEVRPGLCYVQIVQPKWQQSVVNELGEWPTLGTLMALPLDKLVSVEELAAVMCNLDGRSIHIIDSLHGYTLKQVVRQVASVYRTALGTLGSAWHSEVTGLVVDRFMNVGGEIARVGGFWDAAFSYGVSQSADFSREDVDHLVSEPVGVPADFSVHGYVHQGDYIGYICLTSQRDMGIRTQLVRADVGCPVAAVFSLSADGARVEARDCGFQSELSLDVHYDDVSRSRYFLFLTPRTAQIESGDHPVGGGKKLWECSQWKFNDFSQWCQDRCRYTRLGTVYLQLFTAENRLRVYRELGEAPSLVDVLMLPDSYFRTDLVSLPLGLVRHGELWRVARTQGPAFELRAMRVVAHTAPHKLAAVVLYDSGGGDGESCLLGDVMHLAVE